MQVRRRLFLGVVAIVAMFGVAGSSLFAQQRRTSPPQPQQQQGLDYFVGQWTFEWAGRESALGAGQRSGVATFTKDGDSALALVVEGTTDDGGKAFRETGRLEWDATRKVLTMREKLSGGVELTGNGDWSSPIAIRYESSPVSADGEALRLQRHYAILSAGSFQVTEELSVDGGPFVRLGKGDFVRKP
jgi:hypothetical protein